MPVVSSQTARSYAPPVAITGPAWPLLADGTVNTGEREVLSAPTSAAWIVLPGPSGDALVQATSVSLPLAANAGKSYEATPDASNRALPVVAPAPSRLV